MKSLSYKKKEVKADELVSEINSGVEKIMFCGFCRKVTRHKGLKCQRCE